MDNVTHALAGALLAAATIALVERRTPRAALPDAPLPNALLPEAPLPDAPNTRKPSPWTRFRTTAFVVGLVTAELPDADLLYAGPALGMGNLGYLLHHRGHTHTIVFALLAALLAWGVTLLVRRELRSAPWRWPLLALATAGTLSHLLLDFTNSYGVHPFWPVDNRWFYGDAIFIIEPWLWVIALPPLLLIALRGWTRGILGFLLAGILAATWMVDMVSRDVAIVITLATVLWYFATRGISPHRRALSGIGAWVVVELIFFVSSAAARSEVHAATSDSTRRDVVLTPLVGNPFCFSAIVVELDGEIYRSTAAVVAAFPAIRDARGCEGQAATPVAPSVMDSSASPPFTPVVGRAARVVNGRIGTRSVTWREGWEAPHAELLTIVSSRCEARAAMHFIRVPQWYGAYADSIVLFDRRYGAQGVTRVTTPSAGGRCPTSVPGWIPPRRDILGDAVRGDEVQGNAIEADAPLRP